MKTETRIEVLVKNRDRIHKEHMKHMEYMDDGIRTVINSILENQRDHYSDLFDPIITMCAKSSDLDLMQYRADSFNKKYLNACDSSQPDDWYKAAIEARIMYNVLCNQVGITIDILPELQKLRNESE